MEKIIHLDKELLVFLNGLGSPTFDGLWLIITKQVYWIPFFLVLLYFVLKKIGIKANILWFVLVLPIIIAIFYLIYKLVIGIKDKVFLKKLKHLGLILLVIALLILFTDQVTNLFKYTFQRLRPCNDEEIKGIIRIVKSSKTFSFFSGHAANSMATMTFFYLFFRNEYRHAYLVFIFPLIFAYSRIYLGLHFPGDIMTGYIFGAIFGFICYKLYSKYIFNKIS